MEPVGASAGTSVSSGVSLPISSLSKQDSENLTSFANSAQRLSDAVEKLANSTIKVELAPSVVTVNITGSEILSAIDEKIRMSLNADIAKAFVNRDNSANGSINA